METPLAVETITLTPELAPPSLRARARAVVVVADKHASAVDGESRFPIEAIEALKAQRLLGILLPSALGGESADIADVADICYQLAQACASSAMIYAMHQVKTACLMRHGQSSVALQRLLRQLCADQLLLASSTTEGKSGGNVRASEAPVLMLEGRISLERIASVISYGAYADAIVTTARRSSDAPASDQVLVAFFKSQYSLERLQGWNTLGMRGTCSDGYTLRATGNADQIVPEPYETIHVQTMVPFAHLLWGSVWAGIAAGAIARAQAFIRYAARQANGQLPPGAAQFTQALASLRTLRGMLSSALRSYEQSMADPQRLLSLEFQSMITLTKVEASQTAVSIVMGALRVCGLAGYRCDGEFSIERSLRDVLSAPLMINNDRILANLLSSSLMTPLPTSLRDTL